MSNAKYKLHVLQKEPSKEAVFNDFLNAPVATGIGAHGFERPRGHAWRGARALLALAVQPLLWAAAGGAIGAALGFAFARWVI